MAKTKISEFSTTPGNNTDINGINIAEGCAPSGINNAIRELMSDLKEWQSGAMDVYVIPQGTAAAPGIQLYGDLDTGLYGYAANQLGVAVGGASAGYFSSAGWNGNITGDINATTIDTTNLEVTNIKAKDGTAAIALTDSTGVVTLARTTSATNSVNEMLVLEHYSTGTISAGFGSGIKFFGENTGGGNSVYAAIHAVWEGGIGDPSGGALVFLTDGYVGDNTERVRITSEGKVGIGTATPSTTLEVAGSATVTGATTLSATTQNIALGTSQTTGTWTAGGASQTGALTLDQSTKTHTLNLGTGATESGLTKTVNIGTGGVSTSTTTITIGSANGTSTTLNGTVTAATFNSTTIDTTNIEVTNIKAKDGSASATIADSTGVMTIASSVLTTTDINGGTIDGTTIGGSTAAAGTFTTATATTGNITTVNATTVDTTNIEVTNIKAKDGTAALSIADSTGAVTVATALTANGGVTLGDASGDALTINSSAVSTPNGLNFDSNTFVIDATNNRVAVNLATPDAMLNVNGYTGNGTLRIGGASTGESVLYFADSATGTGSYAGFLQYLHTSDGLAIGAGSSERLRITSGGQVNIGGNFTSTNNTLQVTGNAAIGYTTAAPTTGLIVAGNVGVGTDAPTSKFAVSNGTNRLEVAPGASNVVLQALNEARTATTELLSAGSILTYWTGAAGSQAEKMRLDSSGNLGLGVTPSASWSGATVFQTTGGASFFSVTSGGANNTRVANNALWNGSGWRYIATDFASMTLQTAGSHYWYNAPSGTAGNAITFTQAMTLHASGGLSLGDTTDPGATNLRVAGQIFAIDASRQLIRMRMDSNIAKLESTYFSGAGGAYQPLAFYTSDTERARITSGGYFKAQGTSAYDNATGTYHEFISSANNSNVIYIRSNAANGSQYGINIATANDQNDATRYFWAANGGATTRAVLRSNGGLANYSANNVDLASDRRLKNTIEPMRSYYDVFKNINWVTWLYNDQTDDLKNHGVIAQELQELAPEFVCESNAKEAPEGEAPYLGIWEQDFKMAGMSVITELIKKIEKLEAEVAALKGV